MECVFNQNDMIALLDNIERVIIDKNRIGDQWREVKPTDLEQDPNLYPLIEDLFNQYRVESEEVIMSINKEILQHQEMYFEIEDKGKETGN